MRSFWESLSRPRSSGWPCSACASGHCWRTPRRRRFASLGPSSAPLSSFATCFAFALFESWEHWRAGLGWHGLHCLTGPAHRNAIPILAALSLVAAALAAALEHVLAWMRRTIARLRARAAHIAVPVFFAPPQPASLARPSARSVRVGPRIQGSPALALNS